MEDKNIFLFFDWSYTINELISNDKIVKSKFEKFVNAIIKLETANSAKVKFVIVSGTNESRAQKRFNIFKQAFHNINMDDNFLGFAYEYGAYMIDSSNQIIKMIEAPLSKNQWQKLRKITESFDIEIDKDYKSYFNIEFDKFDEKVYAFLDSCKKSLPELDFEVYDDKYGHGIDIKNVLLNKGAFLELFLKKYTDNKPYMIIVGGDSPQDVKMLPTNYECDKYFIGFSKQQKETLQNSILSKKLNIDGIVESLETICNFKVTHYTFDISNIKQNSNNLLECYKCFDDLSSKFGVTLLEKPQIIPYYHGKVKEDEGISLFAFLSPIGHITMHNFERLGKSYIDIFTNKNLDIEKLKHFFEGFFNTNSIDAKILNQISHEEKKSDVFGPHAIVNYSTSKDYSIQDIFEFLMNFPQKIGMTPITLPFVYESEEVIMGIR
ncbi:MAG: hypothetical protein K2K31_02315, partial [Clostridia bacterium]|nr:hypothetical protein [Clostridia bacterium]